MKKLTRIITCYKQWNYIALWITNRQLFNEYTEWIIINDCPEQKCPDKIKDIAKKNEIRVVENIVNFGRSKSRNYGAKISTAKWVDHIDGDDLPLPINESVLSKNNVGVIIFPVQHHRIINSNIVFMDNYHNERYYGHFNDIGCVNYPPLDPRPSSFIFLRDEFLRIGGYDARFDGIEDRHLLWKADVTGIQLSYLKDAKQSYLADNREKLESSYIPLARIRFLEMIEKNCDPDKKIKIKQLLHHYSLQHLMHFLNIFIKISGLANGEKVKPINKRIGKNDNGRYISYFNGIQQSNDNNLKFFIKEYINFLKKVNKKELLL